VDLDLMGLIMMGIVEGIVGLLLRMSSPVPILSITDESRSNERFDEGGYPAQPPSGAWSPAHQKYTQVNI
jgi:hypothetical protein